MTSLNTTVMLAALAALTGCSSNGYDEPRPPMANAAPVVAPIADLSTSQDTVVGPVGFAIGDDTTPANALVVTVGIDGQTPFPADGVLLAGEGATRTVTLTPLEAATGAADVTVSVKDTQGLSTSRVFRVTVTARDASVRDAVVSTFAKQDADEPTALNGFTFAQDADDTAAFANLVGEP